MKGDTYIFNGNLFLTGDINKGSFHATSGVWTKDKKLNDLISCDSGLLSFLCTCLVVESGVFFIFFIKLSALKYDNDFLKINSSNQKAPVLELKGVDNPLTIDSTTRNIKINIDTDYLIVDFSNLAGSSQEL
jgi:hypothetical protein